jgi:hypothetical protein
MPQSKSLLEKARESARRARERAHRKMMWGGQDEVVADHVDEVDHIDEVVAQRAEQIAAQRAEQRAVQRAAQRVEQRAAQRAAQRVQPVEELTPVEAAVERAVQRAQLAEQKAAQVSGEVPQFFGGGEDDFDVEDDFDEFDDFDLEQEGGFKNFELLKAKLAERKALLASRFGADKIPSDKAIMNSLRSYKAIVNGVEIGPKRYFHGSPIAAARKVVGVLNKDVHYTKERDGVVPKDKPAMMPSIGVENALDIKLVEVTKGVHKGKKGTDKYTYEYFGWRDNVKAKGQKDAEKIKVDENGDSFKEVKKGNRVVRVYWENIAIPKRKQTTVQAAIKAKEAAAAKRQGALAKARKAALARTKKAVTVASLISDETVRSELKAQRQARASARKVVPKRPPTAYQQFRSARLKELDAEGIKDAKVRRERISRQWKEKKGVAVPRAEEHLKTEF